ncbi:MAG: hypothetical protein AAFX03_08205 [Pseudomonadota bacterium]
MRITHNLGGVALAAFVAGCASETVATCGGEAELSCPAPASDVDPAEAEKAFMERFGGAPAPDVQVDWIVNDMEALYLSGVEQMKPIVALFTQPDCANCDNLIARFECPALARYADQFVFGHTTADEAEDETGADFAAAFDVDAAPILIVFLPHEITPTAVGRIHGDFSVTDIARVLEATAQWPVYEEMLGTPPPAPSAEAAAAQRAALGLEAPDAAFCAEDPTATEAD